MASERFEMHIVVMPAKKLEEMLRAVVVEEFARRDVAAEVARVIQPPWWRRAWNRLAAKGGA